MVGMAAVPSHGRVSAAMCRIFGAEVAVGAQGANVPIVRPPLDLRGPLDVSIQIYARAVQGLMACNPQASKADASLEATMNPREAAVAAI